MLELIKKGTTSLKEEGFNRTLNRSIEAIKQTGISSSSDDIRTIWIKGTNFGDQLTPYLIEKMTGKKPCKVNKYCFKTHYIMSGSIISKANKHSIIYGTGMMNRDAEIKKPKKIFAVRGPLTRKRLLNIGHKCPKVFGDPGLLLPKYYTPNSKKEYELGIIPHYIDYKFVRKNVSNSNEILIINILDPIEEVIEDINKCKKTISSSLHGLIASHAYGIPSTWVKFSENLLRDDIKFFDYLNSVEIEGYPPTNFKENIPKLKKINEELKRKNAQPKMDTIQKLQTDLMSSNPFSNKGNF